MTSPTTPVSSSPLPRTPTARAASSLLERYAELLTRRAWAVLLAIAALTAVMIFGMTWLRAEFNVEASLPREHPFVEIDRTIRREFGGRNTVIVAIVPREGDVWRTDVLQIVADVTLEALRLTGVIGQNVVSLASPNVRHVEDAGGSIKADLLMRDPPTTSEGIALLRAKVEADPQLKGMLVTPDQRAAIVIVDFWEGPPSHELGTRVMSLAVPYQGVPVDFLFAGEPVFALMDIDQSTEVAWRIPLTFLVIAIMLLVSFRSFQGMFIPMLTATLSVIWGFGLMGFTGVVIDGWNSAAPILLIAIAAGHSAQMLKRYTEEVIRLGDNRAAVIASTVSMGPVMVAAGGVATLGFASLALTGVPSIAGFGLSCAYGIGSAVLLEMSFIPALRTVLPAPKHLPVLAGFTDRILTALEGWIVRSRGMGILVATAVILLLSIGGIFRIRTYGSTREYIPLDSTPRRHLEEIEKHFPGTVTMTILYSGAQESTKKVAVMHHMQALQRELERNPIVWRTASQVEIVKQLHKIFNPDAPDPYRLPDDQELTSQLLFFGSSPAFERFVNRSESKAVMTAYLRDDDSALVGPLVRDLQAWLKAHPAPEGVEVLIAGGAGPTILAVNEHTTHSKILNILLVLATIYLVSSLMLSSPLGGLYVITPIAISVIVLFGLLGWTGLRLDMGSASLISMAAGVGADYAIYFLYRMREEHSASHDDRAALATTLHTSGRAVIFVAAAIGAGFGVMAFSKYRGLWMFGTLMPAAMVISCAAALSIMPVLVMRTRPRFIFGDSELAITSESAAGIPTERA